MSVFATGLIAVVAQAIAAAGPAATDPDVEAARRLPLTQLAGHTVIMRFAGDRAPGYVVDAVREGRAAGVILFHDNATTPSTTRKITRRLRRADDEALIATDQEGGAIRILDWAPPRRGQYLINTRREARRAGRSAARSLRRSGLNLNLAPIGDRSDPGSVMDTRAFPGSTGKVARLVRASVEAYAGSGVGATVKHFPGLGAADGNTDYEQVTIDRPAAVISRSDLPPFQAAIDAGVSAVMLSHAVYPTLDSSAIASQSRIVVTDLLKDRMGFKGVAMTDSLEAYAVRSRMSMEVAAVRSVHAGIDLVLTTGPGSHLRVVRALADRARRSPAFRARLTDAAARVMALRRTLARR